MDSSPSMPQFERFDQVLQSIGLDVGASEIHGVISGILCAGHSDAHAAWFVELFKGRSDDDLLVVEARQLLGQLYQSTQGYIEGEDLDFTPFLPDDELEIEVRAKALSEWCQGYLYGLGLAGITEAQLKDEAGEAIRDITEFTRLDHEDIESGEETELAYVELEEFLRVAVLLIREALTGKRGKGNDSE